MYVCMHVCMYVCMYSSDITGMLPLYDNDGMIALFVIGSAGA